MNNLTKGAYRFAKRIIDFSLSLVSMVLFSPVLILLALFVFISDGWPVIFRSSRMGKDRQKFTVYKFRTLVNGMTRRKDGLSDKVVINRMAGFMRDTHLDEVLQLYNVIKGDMSLIGPRPLDVPRYSHLRYKDPKWDRIMKVKPGMTCINQIARYSENGFDKTRRLKGLSSLERRNRLALDEYYIKHESPLLDIKITLWTIDYLIFGFFRKLLSQEENS